VSEHTLVTPSSKACAFNMKQINENTCPYQAGTSDRMPIAQHT
jgi:hypothetical protein